MYVYNISKILTSNDLLKTLRKHLETKIFFEIFYFNILGSLKDYIIINVKTYYEL